MAETLYDMADMHDMEPQLRGTSFKGGMRGGGSLTMVKDGAIVGVLPANMLTSTVHKAQRRARIGAPLLDLLLQSMIYGVLNRLLSGPSETSAKAALTQVINRFIISFLEEGVLMACAQMTARRVVNDLYDLVRAVATMKSELDTMHKTLDHSTQRACKQRAIASAINARQLAHTCVLLVSNTPRARFISILGADASAEDRPADVSELPHPIKLIHNWKDEITETPYKNKSTRLNFQQRVMDIYEHCTDKVAKAIARALCQMPIEHAEYASMVWKYAFLEYHSGPNFFREQAEAFKADTPPYAPEQAGLPDGFTTLEQVIDAFGIKDVHTGQGTFAEFVNKGSVVMQEPTDMVIFGHSIGWWRERYVRLRSQLLPDRHKRKRDKSNESNDSNDSNDSNESTRATNNKSEASSSSPNKSPRAAEDLQSPMAQFAFQFHNQYVAQLPTGKHKARVLLEYDAEANRLTGRATKVFYSQPSYEKTRRQYESFKSVLPNMVNAWHFDDQAKTITFDIPPGTTPVTPIEGNSYTVRDSFFGTKLKVVDVSKFGYKVMKVKSETDARVLASPDLLMDFVIAVVVQRAMGITDVGPRQFLCVNDEGATKLIAIDMSDGTTYDEANRTSLFQGNTFTDALFAGSASGKLGKDCALRKALDQLEASGLHKAKLLSRLCEALEVASTKGLLQLPIRTIILQLNMMPV